MRSAGRGSSTSTSPSACWRWRCRSASSRTPVSRRRRSASTTSACCCWRPASALQVMLERGERLDWFDSREVTAYAVISALSLVAFVWHELTTEHPIVDLRILKSRQLAVGVVFGGVLGICLYATVFVLPVYLQTLQNFTAEQTGF